MNILHIFDERWDSGITNYGMTLASGQKEKGHVVIAACLRKNPASRQAEEAGVEVVPLSLWKRYLGLRRLVKSRNINVIHAHTGRGNLIGYRARSEGVKLVRSRCDARPAKRGFFSRFILKNTDHIICAAEFIRRDVKDACPGLPDEKLSVVYPGIEPREVADVHEDTHKERPLRVGILGRLDPVKGHGCFIKAARIVLEHLPDTKFIIAGKEENVKWKELFEAADRFSISHALEYQGYVKNIFKFIDSVDVGVIASLGSEAVSRVALEWMVSGKTLVSSDAGCLGELIDDNIDGMLFPAGDHSKLAWNLVTLGQDYEKMVALGMAARGKVESKFSHESFIYNVRKIYNGL